MSESSTIDSVAERLLAEQRQYRRRSVLWMATLVLGRHQFSCQIWNMSLGGARIRIDVPLQTGTEVYLSIPTRGDIPATVVWVENQTMGLKFRQAPEAIEKLFEDRLDVLGLKAETPTLADESEQSS